MNEKKKTLDANQQETKNFTVIDVTGTPFSIIEESETKKCKVAIGNQLLHAGEFPNVEKAKLYIRNKPWELIINTMFIIAHHLMSNNKTE